MFLAKPKMSNMIDAKVFGTVAEAAQYLNDYLKVAPTVNEAGEEVINNDLVLPKMKAEDWAMIGKLMAMVDNKPTYIDNIKKFA